ncbi:phosphopantetheine-binding protein [Luteimonas sp. A277]
MTHTDRQAMEPGGRHARLSARVRELFADVTGFDISMEDGDTPFVELGMDSLTLTQVSVQLGKVFPVGITFRQLMEDCASVDRLVLELDARLPPDPPLKEAEPLPLPDTGSAAIPAAPSVDADAVRHLVARQMQLMTRQLALLSRCTGGAAPAATTSSLTSPASAHLQ